MTGNDSISAIGTKLAGLKLNPVHYLYNFGETDTLGENDTTLAEEYLVKVWHGLRGKTAVRTFDELRLETHLKSSIVPLDKLPPTSSAIRENLKRCFYVIRESVTLISDTTIIRNPLTNGWFVKNGKMLPRKNLKHFPEDITVLCGCKGKCKKRCKFYLSGQLCVLYCHTTVSDNAPSKCTNHK